MFRSPVDHIRFLSLLVGVFYGGTLVAGVIPFWGSDVSWDGHLCGAVSGGMIAYLVASHSGSHRMFATGER